MKKSNAFLVIFSLFFFFSCVGGNKPVPDDVVILGNDTNTNNTSNTSADNTIVARFDNIEITKATYNAAKSEIQLVVEDLNKVTLSRDYNRWLTYLSQEYIDTFSDPEHLQKVSSSLPISGVQLRSLRDYFTYVFVPSRQNMRVDDIQFVSPTRVYAIMEINPETPVAIYILEKMNDRWLIVVKNQ